MDCFNDCIHSIYSKFLEFSKLSLKLPGLKQRSFILPIFNHLTIQGYSDLIFTEDIHYCKVFITHLFFSNSRFFQIENFIMKLSNSLWFTFIVFNILSHSKKGLLLLFEFPKISMAPQCPYFENTE